MTADQAPIGPVCSICEQYEAIGSLMNLADYTTTRFCAMCGVTFLQVVLDALQGADTTPDPEPADPPPATNEQIVAAVEQARDAAADPDSIEPADLSPPFPGTANVVRSTHGHRGGRKDGDDGPAD